MEIVLYTRGNCSTCSFTKKVLKERGITFTEVRVGQDIDREQVKQRYPQARLLPVVIVGGDFIGTKENLFSVLNEYQGEVKDVGIAGPA